MNPREKTSSPEDLSEKISALRNFSRQLVRELGYLRTPVAGSDLSPSAVHTLLELGMQPGMLARDLATALRLDKSNASRQISKMEAQGLLRRETVAADARSYALFLTDAGHALYQEADDFGTRQVGKVLEQLDDAQQQALGRYMSLYASALSQANLHPRTDAPHPERIHRGYRSGCQSDVVGLVAKDLLAGLPAAQAMAAESAMHQAFGTLLAQLDQPGHHLWLYAEGDQVLGAIALQRDAASQRAQLGWFIVHRTVRGTGAGQMLLQAALAQADLQEQELEATLITRLDQPAPLGEAVYRKAGFAALQTQAEDLWGVPVSRTRFVRQRPAPT